MNLFGYLCPGCGALFNDAVEDGKTKLLHRGLKSTQDKSTLPTAKCVPYHDYVVFRPCGHCCPEVFQDCEACRRGYSGALGQPGHPSQDECYCHYCQETDSSLRRGGKSVSKKALAANQRAKLRQNIADSFSTDELRTLSFDLGIEHENLPEAKDSMARELVAHCERTGRIPDLVARCRELRPKVEWGGEYE